ncbi:hypothetical protein CDL12_06561 [Handroanthus impetiginosus]|uniref:Dof zinc finger protein n=1 Tax=Handroanthus impetiginosus TaxID=429701 RepID=A0A2G9HTB5_9LAMI|nr:hypothetical protein CDL12_06561 [Handroanthus impetiginosus]
MAPNQNNSALAAKPAGKDESKNSTSRKTSSARPQEPALKCPRCDSPNTKFCYYNNYSLTQPRHFCKTCRRYWTRGGALRNVPIGGGCRKNKKMKSSQRLSGDSKDSSGSSDVGGLKFFQGLLPAMDFQLGGINIPRLHTPNTSIFNQFSSFGDISATSCGNINISSSSPCFSLDTSGTPSPLMGLSSFPSLKQRDGAPSGFQLQEMGCVDVHSNLASSIESLSCINQDLHWKLQQQRLAMMFAGDNQKENSSTISTAAIEPLIQRPEPILFQNILDNSKTESCLIGTSRKEGENANLSTEWFFDNSYANVTPTPATSTSNSVNDNMISNWNGIQAWSELTRYTSLP